MNPDRGMGIWFWTPGLLTPALGGGVYVPEEFPEVVDEKIIDATIARTFCYLRDPDYFTDIVKPYRVTTRRSMNDRVRTYVTYDHRGVDHIEHSLRFQGLTTNRVDALRQFLQNTEGQVIGYKSPDDRYFAATITTPEATLTTNHPGRTWSPEDGAPLISEWSETQIDLLLIKEV